MTREGGVLAPLHAPAQQAGVLLREKSLGNHDHQDHIERNRAQQRRERDPRMVQYPVQRAPVKGQHPSKARSLNL